MYTTKTPLFSRMGKGVTTVHRGDYTTGRVFFVDSEAGATSDSTTHGMNPDTPFATIDYAIERATANSGDIIYVLPGHAESVTNATDLLIDVAGLSVIGLGEGSETPTITLTTANTATVKITAANTLFKNFRIVQGYSGGVTAGITLGAAADGSVIDSIHMKDGGATSEFLIFISLTDECDDATIQNCSFYGSNSTCSACIKTAGGCDRLIIRDCFFIGNASAAVFDLDAETAVSITILRNRAVLESGTNAKGLIVHGTTTGIAAFNYFHIGSAGAYTNSFSGAKLAYFENLATSTDEASGLIYPDVDS